MLDFINQFIGGDILKYPFLAYTISTLLCSVILFMFYTIVGSVFRMK